MRPDAVVHLAARAGVRASVDDPLSYVQVNEVGGLFVLEACRSPRRHPHRLRLDVERVRGRCRPALSRGRPGDHAALALRGQQARRRADGLRLPPPAPAAGRGGALLHGVRTAGSTGHGDVVVHARSARGPRDHSARRRDGARLHLRRRHRGRRDGRARLGDEHARLRHLQPRSQRAGARASADRVCSRRELGVPARVELGKLGASEVAVTCADVSRAARTFGYAPKVSLEEGVRRWVDWTRSSDEAPVELRKPS